MILLWMKFGFIVGVLRWNGCCCRVIKLSSSWEIWGVSGELDDRSE